MSYCKLSGFIFFFEKACNKSKTMTTKIEQDDIIEMRCAVFSRLGCVNLCKCLCLLVYLSGGRLRFFLFAFWFTVCTVRGVCNIFSVSTTRLFFLTRKTSYPVHCESQCKMNGRVLYSFFFALL